MPTNHAITFDDLVEQSLEIRLPPHLAAAFDISELPPDTQAFIARMFPLMQRAGYSATGFNPALIRWLSTTIPSVLPSAWGGMIPPITLPDRHRKLDAYVAGQNRAPGNAPHTFVDVGCGFPPVTSADTARKLSDWQVFGVDRAFADYVLYDPEGHYACFDQEGGFQYFQAMMTLSGRALYADPQATRKYFDTLFQDLLPLLPGSNGAASKTAEKDGNRLIHNHIRDFETDNLRFIKADIAQLEIPPATAIRCMNLLIYFEPETREKMLQQIGDHLHNDGILIAGTNGLGIQSRYAVYRKGDKGLFPGEFAFSLDNLGHLVFMPWFTIHANDPEALLLADLAGAIRADHSFWPAFSDRLDELQQQHDICRREPDGFLHFEQEEMPYSEYLEKNARLWSQMAVDGFLDRAVSVLNRTGFKAWKNPVGDLAVEPPPGTLPLS